MNELDNELRSLSAEGTARKAYEAPSFMLRTVALQEATTNASYSGDADDGAAATVGNWTPVDPGFTYDEW